MALTRLQSEILRLLAENRSSSSYLAGGLMLNRNWERQSDDIDIFQDTDEQITEAALADLAAIEKAGYRVHKDVLIYGCVEATISDGTASTVMQWMSESRRRFFPLVKDREWGARLHHADLAVNKVLAAAARSKARDVADLIAIGRYYCPLGPLILAAAGKPPNFSPRKTIDEIRRRALSIAAEDFASIKGLPPDWSAALIRDEITRLLDDADRYIMKAPPDLVGVLAVDEKQTPIEVSESRTGKVILRQVTDEPEVMPNPADFDNVGWKSSVP